MKNLQKMLAEGSLLVTCTLKYVITRLIGGPLYIPVIQSCVMCNQMFTENFKAKGPNSEAKGLIFPTFVIPLYSAVCTVCSLTEKYAVQFCE